MTHISGYWQRELERFDVDPDGNLIGETVLGMVSHKRGLHTLGHRVMQAPFVWMGRKYPDSRRNLKLARAIAERHGRAMTLDYVRNALSLALIQAHVNRFDGWPVVIGDGLGIMASLLYHTYRRVVVVNLPKPLKLDRAALFKSAPDMPHGQALFIEAQDARQLLNLRIGLAVSTAAFQEMTPQSIAEYFNILRRNIGTRTYFYCSGRKSKPIDGVDNRFHELPWEPNDRVLHDGPAPWDEWGYGRKGWYRKQPMAARLVAF